MGHSRPSRSNLIFTFVRCGPIAAVHSGGTDWLRPKKDLEINLFRYGKGVIDLDAEIPDGALDLCVAEQ